MRVVAILFGVLMMVGGFLALSYPTMAYLSIAWLIGICILLEAIGETASLIDRRKSGRVDPWTVVSTILSFIVGALLIFSIYADMLLSAILTYLISIWIIMLGIMSVLKGSRDRKSGNMGWLPTLLGLMMILFGIVGFFSPSIIAFSTGVFAGVAIILSGIALAAQAIAY